MKDQNHIRAAGLQGKIFGLILGLVVVLIGAYIAVFAMHQKNLARIVEKTGAEQQQAITETSEATIETILNAGLTRSTALQAYIADDLFSEVRANVSILRAVAEQLFANAESIPPHAFAEPSMANAGKPSVQVQHELGVDPAASEDLALVANMSEIMMAVFESCDKLSSCFVATTDGCILYVDDRAEVYIDEDGTVAYAPEIRARPWYTHAVETGKLIFSSVEADTFTGTLGLVCAAPVYRDGELAAVVGGDIFLTSVHNYIQNTATDGGFLCVVNDNGQVLFSPQEEGVFRATRSRYAADLRQSENRELADFITRALSKRTGISEVAIDGREWYLSGAPMPSVGWTIISVVDKEVAHRPTVSMLTRYDAINQRARETYWEGAKNSARTAILITVILVAVAVACARAMGLRIVRPLQQLTQRINAQQSGDVLFLTDDSYRTGDEIEILADAFSARTHPGLYPGDHLHHGGEKAHRHRAGPCRAHPGRHAAEQLPGLSGPHGVRPLRHHGPGQGGRRRLLRLLPHRRWAPGPCHCGRVRQGRAGSAADDDHDEHAAELRHDGAQPRPGAAGGQRSALPQQPGRDVRHGLVRHPRHCHRENHRRERRA